MSRKVWPGEGPDGNKLKLFISHAKADGLFLAHSLTSLIKEVPELRNWYDANDIESGDDWSEAIETAAANSVLLAIRTDGYEYSSWCRREFETALVHGVPIVVVDALLRPTVTPSSLPFAAMPTVRIPDGNTHRVLTAALREHLRLLLVETLVAERVPEDMKLTWRVWPRLPQNMPAVYTRQHHIEDDQVVMLRQRQVLSVDAVSSEVDDVPALGKTLAQVIPALWLVFNDQNPSFAPLPHPLSAW